MCGFKMPSKYLLEHERVARYVPWSKLRISPDETEIYGPLAAAFKLREGEASLSVTWCEYFEGSEDHSLRCAVEAVRNSRRVGSKARFAVVDVGKIVEFMKSNKKRLRVIHEPTADNPAHAAIRGWPADEDELLERIAGEVWSETWSKDQIDEIPLGECPLSDRASA